MMGSSDFTKILKVKIGLDLVLEIILSLPK